MFAGKTWLPYWHCIVMELSLAWSLCFCYCFLFKGRSTKPVEHSHHMFKTQYYFMSDSWACWYCGIQTNSTMNAWRMTNNKNFSTVSRPWISRKCSDLSTIVEEHHILRRFLAKELHSDCKGLFSFHWHTHSTSLAKFLSVVLPPDSTLKIAIIYVENKVFPVV